MDDIIRNLPGLSIEGILLIIIIREIASFLRLSWDSNRVQKEQKKVESLENSINAILELLRESQKNTTIKTAIEQIDDLHKWHAITDQDGIPVWYVRRDFPEAIVGLTRGIEMQARAMTEAIGEIKNFQREIISETRNIQKDVSRLEQELNAIKYSIRG